LNLKLFGILSLGLENCPCIRIENTQGLQDLALCGKCNKQLVDSILLHSPKLIKLAFLRLDMDASQLTSILSLAHDIVNLEMSGMNVSNVIFPGTLKNLKLFDCTGCLKLRGNSLLPILQNCQNLKVVVL
jgi:hypothetical protein